MPRASDVVLAADGKARVVIYAPARLFVDEAPLVNAKGRLVKRRPPADPILRRKKAEETRLLESARDLQHYLSRLSGAEVELTPTTTATAIEPSPLPILLGELAEQRFGPVGSSAPGGQGFRVVVRPEGLGLYGEGDLGTSYAVYELLDRLGCRWFMPGDLGEVVPAAGRVALPRGDDSLAPSTIYRGVWYADTDFKRRNRLGGIELAAGHMLERWISDAQRQEHPEWRAVIKGQPHPKRLRWSNPELAKAMAASIASKVEGKGLRSVSLSPADGVDFDDSDDPLLDAGDWDPTTNSVSLTDRLLVLTNRVASELKPRHPELMLGVLAYVSYSRPPVRESVHPNVVPMLAPITYCREKPWNRDDCPGAATLRGNIEAWARHADRLGFRGYTFNLAEPAAPNPMIGKLSWDLPFLMANKVRFYQPETMPTFEATLPALWLGIRLSFDAHRRPEAELADLYAHFYGHASVATRRYLELIDRAWLDTPEHAGGSLGYAQRFPPGRLARARAALNEAIAACRTGVERARVAMLDHSLSQLELYMKMQRDLGEGRLDQLLPDLRQWLKTAKDLSERYAANSAFGKAGWAKEYGIYGYYAKRFLEPIYSEAAAIAAHARPLLMRPVCDLRFWLEPEAALPASSAAPAAVSARRMDVCRQTWSSVGLHDYFGSMWYEVDVQLGDFEPDKPLRLWLSKADGAIQVWVNGVSLHVTDAPDSIVAETHLRPLTFNVSGAARARETNRVTILARRTRLAELGAGGLLGPIYLYQLTDPPTSP